MVGWHHRLDGHEFEQALGIGDGQGSLECCSPWGHKALDMTEWLNWTDRTLSFHSGAETEDACPGRGLAMGLRLLLIHKISSDTRAGNKMEENEKFESAGISVLSALLITMSFIQSCGCCLTSASKPHVRSSLGSLHSGQSRVETDGIFLKK